MSDTKHLVLRGNVWWFVRRVPKNLKHLYPTIDRIQKSLDTSDIRTARTKRDVLLGEMQKLSLSTMSSERSLFKHHLRELKAIKEQEESQYEKLLDSMSPEDRERELRDPQHDPLWHQVSAPDYIGREDDRAYVEAYKAVSTGREHSPEFSITLLVAVEEYCTYRRADVTPTTLSKTKRSVLLLLDFLGKNDTRIDAVDGRQAFDWLRHLESIYGGNTVFTHLSNVRNVYRWVINRGDIRTDNPFDGQQVNTSANHQKYQLFDGKELRQLNQLILTQSEDLNLLFQMGLHTGARLSELGELHLNQIFLDAPIPYLLIKTGKQKVTSAPKYRSVPIAQRIVPLIKRQYQRAQEADAEYLFFEAISVDRKDNRPAQRIGALFGRVKQLVTRERSKAFQSLRVHAATWHQANNIPEHVAYTLLGHTNGQTMSYAYYAKQNPDLAPYKEAIEMLADRVQQEIGEDATLTGIAI